MKDIKILVPIDFSDLSYRAFTLAEIFAKQFNGTITPFHSYIPLTDIDGSYYMGLGVTTETTMSDIEPVLMERLEQAALDEIDSRYINKPVLGIGSPVTSIIEEAENFDLIIMSTHGRTGFSRFLMGSVAEKVLRLSHTPVLLIEKRAETRPIRKILVTTDFSANSEAAFTYAVDIAQKFDAKIELIHISGNGKNADTTDEKEKRLSKLAEKYFQSVSKQVKTEVIQSGESPHEAIINLDKARHYDLIVMTTIGRTGLRYLTMGSTTANVVRMVDTPVLSINPLKKDTDN